MKPFRWFAAAMAIVVPWGGSASDAGACEPVHLVAYQHAAGSALTLRVNDAVVFRALPGGQHGGSAAPRFLVNGTNTLQATLEAGDADAPSARLELFQGCEGAFPQAVGQNDNVLASLTLEGADTAQTTFELTGQPQTAWSTAAPSEDDAGLIEAAQGLIQAAKAKDVDAYVGFFGPMVADMSARGMPAQQMLAGMASGVFAEMTVVEPKALSTRPILDGRVWAVTDADGKAPLQFQGPGGEMDTLEQGMYWVRDGAAWGIVRQ